MASNVDGVVSPKNNTLKLNEDVKLSEFSPSARLAIAGAGDMAKPFRQPSIEPELLLYKMLDVYGLPSRTLYVLDIDPLILKMKLKAFLRDRAIVRFSPESTAELERKLHYLSLRSGGFIPIAEALTEIAEFIRSNLWHLEPPACNLQPLFHMARKFQRMTTDPLITRSHLTMGYAEMGGLGLTSVNPWDIYHASKEAQRSNIDNLMSSFGIEVKEDLGMFLAKNNPHVWDLMGVWKPAFGAASGIILSNAVESLRKKVAAEDGSDFKSSVSPAKEDNKSGTSKVKSSMLESCPESEVDLSQSKKDAIESKSSILPAKEDDKSSCSEVKSLVKKLGSGEKLEESESQENLEFDGRLVGLEIRVWWPVENKFYEGLIVAYYFSKKKFKVAFQNGHVLLLDLKEERWEALKKGCI